MAQPQNATESFNAILNLAYRLARGSWRELAWLWGVQAVLLAALVLGINYLGVEVPQIMGLRPGLLVSTFFLGAAIHRLIWRYGPSLGESRAIAGRAYLSVLAIAVVTQIATTIGFVFLIIPGLVISVLLMSAPAIMLAERPGIFDAMRKSAERTLPILFPAFGACLVAAFGLLAGMIIVFPAVVVGTFFGKPVTDAVLAGGFFGMVTLWQAIMATSVYLHLRGAAQPLNWTKPGPAA